MNTATADLQTDIANGKEPREFLGQSVGFENELIGQTKLPHQPPLRSPLARGRFFLTGWFSRTSWKSRPGPAASGRNMPSTARVRQGGKLGRPGAGAPVPA